MMGELSQQIGKRFEGFVASFFEHLEWDLLGENIEISCNKKNHKSSDNKSEKHTHGIDILAGFYNPFSGMQEAAVIECKNRQWKNFSESQLNIWVSELVNTIECASVTEKVTNIIDNHMITTGILMFNSSDEKYDEDRAKKSIESIEIPRKKLPLLIYIADCEMIDRWQGVANEIHKMKNKGLNFGIIYPSINGSKWEKINQLTPMYIFSDYILATYSIKKENSEEITDIKSIFCFDKISESCFDYIDDMISKLQLEYKSNNEHKFEILLYPTSSNDIFLAEELFKRSDLIKRSKIELKFLQNRKLPPAAYGKFGV